MDHLKQTLTPILLDPKNHDFLAIVKGLRNGIVYGAKIRFPHALVMTVLFRTGTVREKLVAILTATKQHAVNLGSFVTIYKSIMYILGLLHHSSRHGKVSTKTAIEGIEEGVGKEGGVVGVAGGICGSAGIGGGCGCSRCDSGSEPGYHSLLAGLIGGYLIFGRSDDSNAAVNQQIVLYVFARVAMALANLAVQHPRLAPSEGNLLNGKSTGDSGSSSSSSSSSGGGGGGGISKLGWPAFASLSWGLVMYLFRWHPEAIQPSLRSSMTYLYVNSDTWDGWRNFLWHNR